MERVSAVKGKMGGGVKKPMPMKDKDMDKMMKSMGMKNSAKGSSKKK